MCCDKGPSPTIPCPESALPMTVPVGCKGKLLSSLLCESDGGGTSRQGLPFSSTLDKSLLSLLLPLSELSSSLRGVSVPRPQSSMSTGAGDCSICGTACFCGWADEYSSLLGSRFPRIMPGGPSAGGPRGIDGGPTAAAPCSRGMPSGGPFGLRCRKPSLLCPLGLAESKALSLVGTSLAVTCFFWNFRKKGILLHRTALNLS